MQHVVVIDGDKCTGCRVCELVCSLSHAKECNPERSRISVMSDQEEGELLSFPITCMQCEKAICEIICPTKAIHRDLATGARLVDPKKCIGCSACAYVCPFGAPFVDPIRGVAIICDLCEGDPLCVKYCPTGAIEYVMREEVNIRLKRGRMGRFFHYSKVLTALSQVV